MSTNAALSKNYDSSGRQLHQVAIQSMLKHSIFHTEDIEQMKRELQALKGGSGLMLWEQGYNMSDLEEYEKTFSKEERERVSETVIDRLYNLRKFRKRNHILRKQIKEAEKYMFIDLGGIQITANYGDGVGGGGGLPSSPVERAIMEPYNQLRDLRIELARQVVTTAIMDQALSKLNAKELHLIEEGYLTSELELNDTMIMEKMKISKATFYARKKSAIWKLAVALQLI